MSYKCEPEVKIIKDSSINGDRITTFHLKYWRAIHSEFMTHREFSRNARSSRATPVSVVLDELKDIAIWGPNHIGLNEKGMSASKELEGEVRSEFIKHWQMQAYAAISYIEDNLLPFKVHKQVINRLLEPFNCIDVIMTTTNLDHFFALRNEEHAQPEMRDLAIAMRKAYNESTPISTFIHIPYIDKTKDITFEDLLISAARCARISYKAFDGTTDENKDLELALRLLKDGHMSPFEHIAFYIGDDNYKDISFIYLDHIYKKYIKQGSRELLDLNPFLNKNYCGNFKNWAQFRKLLHNEYKV